MLASHDDENFSFEDELKFVNIQLKDTKKENDKLWSENFKLRGKIEEYSSMLTEYAFYFKNQDKTDERHTAQINKLKDRIAELSNQVSQLQFLLDIQTFLMDPEHTEQKKQLKQEGWVDVFLPCSAEDSINCLTRAEGLCSSENGKCHIKINLNKLCEC